MYTFDTLTQEEKLDLYNKCKELYYNGGESPLSDSEFDELEKMLGLENKGYIGSKKGKYTVPHPFLMGSLSKIQIKEDENHHIDWIGYGKKAQSYLSKSNGYLTDNWFYECTCKYDGCSWEAVIDRKGNLVSVSTRGDGTKGVDISPWFEEEWKTNYEPYIQDYYKSMDDHSYLFLQYLVVRGECLVKKSVFMEKYSQEFTLPRSFVAGCLGQDWINSYRQKEMRSDLSWIAYDFREVYENGTIIELDYTGKDKLCNIKTPLGNRPDFFYTGGPGLNMEPLYHMFEEEREKSEFALDGFVLKPGASFRLQDGERARQEDCVAIKFLPEVVSAELIDVVWNVGKTGEYYPTGILAPIILGDKKVDRVSLSNYGKIINENIGIGSKLKISQAGDIIPYCYQVITGGTPISLPKDSYVEGVHLMKNMNKGDEMYIKFINSVNVLKPDGIGEKVAEKLFKIWPTGNIVNFMINDSWQKYMDDSKSSQNILTSLIERKKTLTLPDLIQSMGYENCGEKNSLYLAKVISNLNPDPKGIPSSIIELGETNEFHYTIWKYMESLGLEKMVEEVSDKIMVILTGSPKNAGYSTKVDFLVQHPQLRETTQWSETKILITDSLDSTSSKMEKAKKKGIPIKTYFDF